MLVAALRIGTGSFRYGPELLAALPIAAADGTLAEARRGRGERGAREDRTAHARDGPLGPGAVRGRARA